MSFPQIVLTNMWYVETRTCISFETLVQHAIYEPHTSFIVVPFPNYTLVLTTRFFRLDLFFITAIMLISLNVFLIFLRAKRCSVFCKYSRSGSHQFHLLLSPRILKSHTPKKYIQKKMGKVFTHPFHRTKTIADL